MHGKRSQVFHDRAGVFTGLPTPVGVARYHSLAVDPLSLPESLSVTAVADDGEVMAIRHRDLPILGVQFHPESVFTDHGLQMLANAADVLSAATTRQEVLA
jgi:anthranilate synthase component 2